MPMTQTQLADAVAEKAGLSRADAKKAISALEEVILDEIGNAEKVKIGGVVQLDVRVRPATQERPGRNPATGEEITISAKPASVAVKARPLAKAKAAVQFGTDGTHITANGTLFFPVLSYEQCSVTLGRALALGVNTFVQVPFTGCTDPAVGATPYVLSDSYSAQAGIGWYLPDEPDGWGITPGELPQLPPASQTGRLRVLNISQHFYSGQAPINAQFDRSDYKRFAALADVVVFDMYPIVKFCGRLP